MVYLYRAGTVVAAAQAFRAKVRCLVVGGGDRVYCGGGGGVVKVLDARTLATMQSFNLLPADPTAAARLNSAGTNDSVHDVLVDVLKSFMTLSISSLKCQLIFTVSMLSISTKYTLYTN